jgi:bromodomain-containing protein 7
MGSLIREPAELFESENVWAGKEWKRRRIEKLKAECPDLNMHDVKDEQENVKDGQENVNDDDEMVYEGTDMLMHVLDYSAGLIKDLDQRLRSGSRVNLNGGPSLKRSAEEAGGDIPSDEGKINSANEQYPDEDSVLRDLRLNLLALAKRAPLDKIARLPAELVPEHIRHYVPTLG